jgi:HAD superfamily hydrolase (TIGR01509 family)
MERMTSDPATPDASHDHHSPGGLAGQDAGPAAVVFDLDGVLIDSERLWDEVRRGLVLERGGRWEPDSQTTMMGMSTQEWSDYLVGLGVGMTAEEVVDEVVGRLGARYGEALPVLDGAPGVVRALADRTPLAVASSSPRTLIELVLRAAGLDDAFTAIVSSEEVDRGKPAPDVYLEAARRLGVPAERCVAVEDSTNGVRAAAAAGMAVVVVPNPHYPPSDAALALAAARVGRIGELTPLVTREAWCARPG